MRLHCWNRMCIHNIIPNVFSVGFLVHSVAPSVYHRQCSAHNPPGWFHQGVIMRVDYEYLTFYPSYVAARWHGYIHVSKLVGMGTNMQPIILPERNTVSHKTQKESIRQFINFNTIGCMFIPTLRSTYSEFLIPLHSPWCMPTIYNWKLHGQAVLCCRQNLQVLIVHFGLLRLTIQQVSR